jgi:uncharacterized protein YecT (DUF1311 family)
MIKLGLAAATLSAAWSGPGLAAAWMPDQNACNQQSSTVDIVECLQKQTKVWDGRLNQAYQALTAMLKSDQSAVQLDDLLRAQRLWLQYRNANCGYYGDEQGTIRMVEGAECMRRMTQDRAIELQQAGPH